MGTLKFFVMVLLSMVLIMPTDIIAAARDKSRAANEKRTTWLWHTREIAKDPEKIISFLSENDVKDLYLQIDYDLEFDVYKGFIEKASEKSINVHALEGSPEWVTDHGINLQQLFFDWVTKYQEQSSANEQFKGIHLDVEPYLKEQYSSNKNGTLEYYQTCLSNALNKSEKLGLELSVSIPFWFDEVTYDTSYGKGILAEWIISHTKSVVIMAYRNKALGDNGIISLVSSEIKWAKQYQSVVIVAVETEHSYEGSFVSFYKKGQSDMNNELKAVYDKYKTNSSFGGVGIHHVLSWMNLKK